jgi:hypothetical protein
VTGGRAFISALMTLRINIATGVGWNFQTSGHERSRQVVLQMAILCESKRSAPQIYWRSTFAPSTSGDRPNSCVIEAH